MMTRPSHMLVRKAAWEQNEVTGGISLVSNFPLTSCPAAAVYCCLAIKHVWQGDIQVSKAWGVVKEQRTIKELCKQQFRCKHSTENRPTRGISSACKKGKSTVLFLFSQVGSCISASHLRFQPSHMIVCLVKAHEHCHLVVISKASNYTNLHLRKGHYVNITFKSHHTLFKLAGVTR